MLRSSVVMMMFAALASVAPSTSLAAAQDEEAGRRETVRRLLQAPTPGTMVEIARALGDALRALPFDGLPFAQEFITDDDIGSDAAYAMLGADETRGLTRLLESIPQSGPNIQRIAFTWYLNRYDALVAPLTDAARTAALRTLEPVRSTANAEAALYVLGLTGSSLDVPVLEFHRVNFRTGSRGMRDASHAALVRLGSPSALERVRTELIRPFATDMTYQQGMALMLALQKAAFSGRSELVPAVCSHIQDPPLRGGDARIDTGRSARLALNAIVDRVSVTHLSSGSRSTDDWTRYCGALGPSLP